MKQLREITNTLKLLGLTDIETNVYLEILRIGNMPASTVANRLKINRSTTRYTLENLVKKRFVFQTDKNGTYHFTAEEPEKILILLKNQKEEINQKEVAVEKVIGDLKNLQNPHSSLPKVRFFEGVDGIIDMYEDILIESKKNNCNLYGYAHLDYKNTPEKLLNFLDEVYVPTRDMIQNKSFFIFNKNEENAEYLKHDEKLNRTIMFLPEKDLPFKSAFHIYNNKVSFSYHEKDTTPSGIIIEHDNIKNDLFSLFKAAWKHGMTLPENKHCKTISL